MNADLTYLAWTALFTALMWVPYVLNMILVRGLIDAVGYPENQKPMAPWAQRMCAAHYNAVENLVVFGVLVLIANAAGMTNETTATAGLVFLLARIVHFFAYTFKIPWVRTLSFVAGFVCQVMVAMAILF